MPRQRLPLAAITLVTLALWVAFATGVIMALGR